MEHGKKIILGAWIIWNENNRNMDCKCEITTGVWVSKSPEDKIGGHNHNKMWIIRMKSKQKNGIRTKSTQKYGLHEIENEQKISILYKRNHKRNMEIKKQQENRWNHHKAK